MLVTRGNGLTSFYPSISNDSKLVVFNTSTCGTDPDSNKLRDRLRQPVLRRLRRQLGAAVGRLAPGGASTLLKNANGVTGNGNPLYGNSWPRFSPDKGTFRGNELYWIAFSSRRPYGLQVNTAGGASTKPQLWIAGVIAGERVTLSSQDPSFAPVWLPAQNPDQTTPNGNHVPQWVKVAVVIN